MSSAIALKAPPLAAAGAATSAAARPSARSPHAAAPFPPPGQELCGEPVTAVLTVPACKGLAVRVAKGQLLRVTNISGVQVCDLWCFGTDTAGTDGLLRTAMSMPHTHDALRRHTLAPGDALLTGQRRAILTFVEDSGPGAHDSTVPACSLELYQSMLGVEEHDSCTANLHASLKALGYKLTDTPSDFLTPSPINLWMTVPLRDTTAPSLAEWWAPPHPAQKAGDYVVLRAELNCVCVMSSCPGGDLSPLNGGQGAASHDTHCQVFEAA